MGKSRGLYIFIRDDDQKTFSLYGPILVHLLEDWLKKGAEAVSEGRRVKLFEIFEDLVEASVAAALKDGLKPVNPESIISVPRDRSAEYQGNLPGYAQAADRDRVIHILCKGKCRALRWAELSSPYPGVEMLKRAEMGTFSAVCLRCGKVAQDSYNWTRP